MTARPQIFALLVVVLGACTAPSQREWAKSAVGSPVDGLFSLASQPDSYAYQHGGVIMQRELGNGHSVYLYPMIECNALFEVDGRGIIVGFRMEAENCT